MNNTSETTGRMKTVNARPNPDHQHRFTEKVRIDYGMGSKGHIVKMCWKCPAYLVKE